MTPRRLVAILLLGLAGMFLAGCETTGQSESEEVSTIPWNRPQSWEGSGALGGIVPQSN